MSAQLIGGLLGTALAHAMFELPLLTPSVNIRTGHGQFLAETVATFGLVMTILGGLKYRAEAVPMLVGLYITAGYWFTASTSFANPAVTLARGFTEYRYAAFLVGPIYWRCLSPHRNARNIGA